jgi:hypothetical protein
MVLSPSRKLIFSPIDHGTHMHKSRLLAPTLSEINPVHPLLLSRLRPGHSSLIFHSQCPTKILYALFISSELSSCRSHLILLDFISFIISHEEYKLFNLLIVQFSPASWYFLKYSPRYAASRCP